MPVTGGERAARHQQRACGWKARCCRHGILYTAFMRALRFVMLAIAVAQTTAVLAQSSQAPTPSNQRKLLDEAKADLAKRLSVPTSAVTLVSSRSVVWSNGSLGCPERGMSYAAVLTPGYLVVFKAQDREYEYHSSRLGPLAYCADPSPPSAATPDDL